MKKSIFILFVISLSIFGCKKEEVSKPDVNNDEVGFVNETDFSADWGIRYAGNSINVGSGESSVLPYSNDGYWVAPFSSFDILYASPNRGQTILLYEDDDYYKIRIE